MDEHKGQKGYFLNIYKTDMYIFGIHEFKYFLLDLNEEFIFDAF